MKAPLLLLSLQTALNFKLYLLHKLELHESSVCSAENVVVLVFRVSEAWQTRFVKFGFGPRLCF